MQNPVGFMIQGDRVMETKTPGIVLIEKERRQRWMTDITYPTDNSVERKVNR